MTIIEFERVERAWLDLAPWLCVPHTQTDYQRLVALVDALLDHIGDDESHPLATLVDLVGTLMEEYENQHVAELA